MNIITCCRCYRSGSSWLRVTPFAIRKQLKWIKDRYNNIPMYITENGVTDRNGSLIDTHRISYYRAYINEVLKGTFNLQFITLKKKCNYSYKQSQKHDVRLLHLTFIKLCICLY